MDKESALSRSRRSYEIYERAGELIPGYTQLRSRLANGFAEGISPVYAQSAKGSRFTDVDGNEYIDWVNAVSAIILGHADDVVDGAVKEFFPGVDLELIVRSVDHYKSQETWPTEPSLNEPEYQGLQDILMAAGMVKERQPYTKVVRPDIVRQALSRPAA